MGICELFRRSQPPRSTATESVGRTIDFNQWEIRRELRRAKLDAEDAAAKLRAVSYVAPVRVIKGATHQFLEVQQHGEPNGAVIAPIPFIAGIRVAEPGRAWPGASGVVYVVISMSSGLEHRVRIERASADILLSALIGAWTTEEAA